MTNTRLWLVSAVLGLGGALTTLMAAPQAAPPAPPPATRPAEPITPASAYRAKDLLGSKVFIQGNAGVGTVDDIVFSNEGVVDYLIVTNERNQLVSVPWPVARYAADKRAITIDVTPQQFQTIPTFTTTTYPNWYAPTYRTEIYRAYGLTPGQERRLERRLERR